MTTILADQVFDAVSTHVRKHLAECRGRTRSEVELLFANRRIEVARILKVIDAVEDDER
jgi:hypothetical protein